MSKNKSNNKKKFVDAVRARGGKIPRMALGGPMTLQPSNAPVNLSAGAVNPSGTGNAGGITSGGVLGWLTPQSQYAAQLAPTTQLNYSPLINQAANQALAGYGAQNANIAQQQALEQQFLNTAAGQGPNPAQAQLAQNTGANIAAQNALAAGQRGAASNVGLIERQAAQQGGAAQQAATGQAATLQAQQQLAAQQAAAAQQAQIGSQIANQQAAANQLLGTGAGALNTQNANLISNYGTTQGINAGTAQSNTKATQSTLGGILGGVGSAIGSIFGLADGGEVPDPDSAPTPAPTAAEQISKSFNDATGKEGIEEGAKNLASASYATGGPVGAFIDPTEVMSGSDMSPIAASSGTAPSQVGKVAANPYGPKSMAGQLLQQQKDPLQQGYSDVLSPIGQQLGTSLRGLVGLAPVAGHAKGGKIKEPVSGEKMAAKGMKVPGEAKKKGDSLKNDTVPAMLSPGEIVLPRSVVNHPDAPSKAAAFVQAIQAKHKMRRHK